MKSIYRFGAAVFVCIAIVSLFKNDIDRGRYACICFLLCSILSELKEKE